MSDTVVIHDLFRGTVRFMVYYVRTTKHELASLTEGEIIVFRMAAHSDLLINTRVGDKHLAVRAVHK